MVRVVWVVYRKNKEKNDVGVVWVVGDVGVVGVDWVVGDVGVVEVVGVVGMKS